MMPIYVQIFLVLIGLSALLYFAMTSLFFYGWIKIPVFKSGRNLNNITSVTVVIAARNEEKKIISCLNSILKQDYPEHLFEIIIVDDSSEDATIKICNDFINEISLKKIRLIKLSDYNKTSKKEAVRCGVENAKGTFIITTDADCIVGNRWIASIASYYEKSHFKLICGPVTYHKYKGFFHQFQLLDFLSMIISGAGAIGINKSFIGNAANMAFEKDAFLKVVEAQYDSTFASGDDVFLMHKIKEKVKNGIGFLKSEESIVYTEPKENLKELVLQRLRWASKSKGFRDFDAMFFAVCIFLFNFMMVSVFFVGLFNLYFFLIFMGLLFFKILADLPLIYRISSFNNRKDLMMHYLWIQCVYPFYIAFTAILSFFKTDYLWKGRRCK